MRGSAPRQFPKGNLRRCQESKNQFEEHVGRVNVVNLCKFVFWAKFEDPPSLEKITNTCNDGWL